jgi:hypothetical protein
VHCYVMFPRLSKEIKTPELGFLGLYCMWTLKAQIFGEGENSRPPVKDVLTAV